MGAIKESINLDFLKGKKSCMVKKRDSEREKKKEKEKNTVSK